METQANKVQQLEGIFHGSEFNRFGLITVVILLIGCLGGISIGMGAINNTFALALVVFPTMATLSLLLSVSPMKWILGSALLCVVINAILITFYAIF